MTDEEYEFVLTDRIAKIQAINEQYDLEHNAYLSFSGGLDSVIVSRLLDMALPNNHIPRVYANTGIEYVKMVKFVKSKALEDERFIILNQTKNIKKTLNEYGYPFKSKEHSLRVEQFNKGHNSNYIKKYITGYDFAKGKQSRFVCPNILLYQFEEKGKYNYSNKCCYKLKKALLHQWQIDNNKKMVITGMKNEEGGNRARLGCISDNGKKFHPLIVVSSEWEQEFIERERERVCDLYKPPYNFKRTGCKGCPFDLNIQETLNTMYKLLPKEYYQCLHLWKPVYDEYIRIGFRLKYYPHERGVQMNLFDYLNIKETE